MNRPVRRTVARSQPNPWPRWTVRCGIPAAATALALVWLADTGSPGQGALVATLALAAVMVFASTMPARPRRPARPTAHRVRDARVTVFDAAPDDSQPSDTYELRVHGVSVLVRLRPDPNGHPVPYVHVEHLADRPRVLLVEVDNKGERIHI
ncbi:hypothetical protein ACFRMQ_00140 [Kitasatospora sp. NPDC056783]|uniref:hypothetical protein n=1 Tax=Kitasatospora sp. NPDC056783 TaxID=3345943 RepID=UPI0036880E6C